SGGGIYHDDLV
ncbi:CPXV166 protein, partial [Monkeypox virus]